MLDCLNLDGLLKQLRKTSALFSKEMRHPILDVKGNGLRLTLHIDPESPNAYLRACTIQTFQRAFEDLLREGMIEKLQSLSEPGGLTPQQRTAKIRFALNLFSERLIVRNTGKNRRR